MQAHDSSRYDTASRLMHFALAVLGIAAIVSGQFAGDYKREIHLGFTLHGWIGLGMAAAIGCRILWGLIGPRDMRFAGWLPVTAARLRLIGADLAALARLELPEREKHLGLSGLVQAIGLLAFAFSAVTGVLLYVYLEPGSRAAGGVRIVKELHEGAQAVLLAYLALHVGAVLVHSLAGRPLWRRMLP